MFVLDASVAACWLLDDEDDAVASVALERLEQEDALVPQLWHIEMRNSLLVARRRGRLSSDGLGERLRALAGIPVRTDTRSNALHAQALGGKAHNVGTPAHHRS